MAAGHSIRYETIEKYKNSAVQTLLSHLKDCPMADIIESYSELIKEAFITPIRTVTVIDDEYPTLLSLITVFSDKNATKLDLNNVNINRLKI